LRVLEESFFELEEVIYNNKKKIEQELKFSQRIDKDKTTNGTFIITTPSSEEINIKKYKNYLLNKLSDTLEIAGFDFISLRSASVQKISPITSERPVE
jgi:hypothetical protein